MVELGADNSLPSELLRNLPKMVVLWALALAALYRYYLFKLIYVISEGNLKSKPNEGKNGGDN